MKNGTRLYQYSDIKIVEDWPKLKPFVDTSLQYSNGEKTSADLLTEIIAGKAQLFMAEHQGKVESVFITSIREYPQYKVVFVEAAAGKGFTEYINFFWDSLIAWASANGAVAIEACTRPEVTRLLERKLHFRKVYDIVRVAFTSVDQSLQ